MCSLNSLYKRFIITKRPSIQQDLLPFIKIQPTIFKLKRIFYKLDFIYKLIILHKNRKSFEKKRFYPVIQLRFWRTHFA